MSVTALAFLMSSFLYAGFQWTVRLLVYPQLANVATADFPEFERAHQRTISYVVGPLFLALAGSAVAQVMDPAGGSSHWWSLLAALLVFGILATTGLLAVPLHRTLSSGFSPVAFRRLLAVDTLRLLLALSCAAVSVVVLYASAGSA